MAKGMFTGGAKGKVESKSKDKPMKPVKKSFGFGKQQSQGMKGKPTQYGSA